MVEPAARREATPRRLAIHRAEPEQELPGADVEDAVAAGVDQGQDRRRRRHAHPPETRQQREPPPLAPRGEDGARDPAHPGGGIRRVVAEGARALPPAHPEELPAREPTPAPAPPEAAPQPARAPVPPPSPPPRTA